MKVRTGMARESGPFSLVRINGGFDKIGVLHYKVEPAFYFDL